MEYSIGIYDFPETIAAKLQMDELVNRLAKQRWSIKWMGTSYRGTKLLIMFERVRID